MRKPCPRAQGAGSHLPASRYCGGMQRGGADSESALSLLVCVQVSLDYAVIICDLSFSLKLLISTNVPILSYRKKNLCMCLAAEICFNKASVLWRSLQQASKGSKLHLGKAGFLEMCLPQDSWGLKCRGICKVCIFHSLRLCCCQTSLPVSHTGKRAQHSGLVINYCVAQGSPDVIPRGP